MKNQKSIVGIILGFSLILVLATAVDYFVFTQPNDSGTFHLALLVLVHLTLAALFISLTYQNASFGASKKMKWSLCLALVPFISCMVFYFTYSSEYDRIKKEVEEKMIRKTTSLKEFTRTP